MGSPVTRCLVCEARIEPFLSLGRMPIANGFLRPEQVHEEYFFDLTAGFCRGCMMVQLMEHVDRRRVFHDHYPYFSSTSARMVAHFKRFARSIMADHLRSADPLVVEIGSNDGILLQHVARAGIRHVGVDPSANVARAAMAKGVHTICEFFDERLAEEILRDAGQADAILGANVMSHIPAPNSVAAGVKRLLKPGGVFAFEAPDLVNMMELTSYDQIYDEHLLYLSVTSVAGLCMRHGLELVDVLPQPVHGGSNRYLIAHRGERAVSSAVVAYRAKEEAMGLHRPDPYAGFRRRVEQSREELISLLHALKREGKRVVGYGATAKSTTVTNYCGITPGLIEYISDTTPTKQGTVNPGMHIPIRSHAAFARRYPDYALLFAWNHAEEIMAKEGAFGHAGGKWIRYVPRVEIVEGPARRPRAGTIARAVERLSE